MWLGRQHKPTLITESHEQAAYINPHLWLGETPIECRQYNKQINQQTTMTLPNVRDPREKAPKKIKITNETTP